MLLSTLLSGCVHDRSWQPLSATVPAPAFAVPLPKDLASIPKSPAFANHATVEFLSHGQYADDCKGTTVYKSPCQLNAAVEFIHQARKLAGADELIVLTFIHGNENNASYEHSDNYPHFEQLLNCLNQGKLEYQRINADLIHQDKVFKNPPLDCDGFPEKAGHRKYIGVYIGWRGRFNDTPVNVAQAGGMRIGRSRNIVETLFVLRDAAKDGTGDPARFVVMGHSFGGLLLEQASSRIFRAAYSSGNPNVSGECEHGSAEHGLKPFADLVITLNEAVNGVPAKQLIDYFQLSKQAFCHSSQLAPALYRPLLVSVHSKSDALWTGKTATVVRRIVWWPNGGHHLGTEFPNEDVDGTHPGRLLVYFSTPPNMTYYTNLCYDDGDVPMTNCQAVENLAHFDPSKGYDRAFHSLELGSPSPTANLLVRFRCNSSVLPTKLQIKDMEDCKVVDPSNDITDLHVWNTSPYWLFSVNDDVISGHNFFWGPKLISLVYDMSALSPPLGLNEVIPRESVSSLFAAPTARVSR